MTLTTDKMELVIMLRDLQGQLGVDLRHVQVCGNDLSYFMHFEKDNDGCPIVIPGFWKEDDYYNMVSFLLHYINVKEFKPECFGSIVW